MKKNIEEILEKELSQIEDSSSPKTDQLRKNTEKSIDDLTEIAIDLNNLTLRRSPKSVISSLDQIGNEKPQNNKNIRKLNSAPADLESQDKKSKKRMKR